LPALAEAPEAAPVAEVEAAPRAKVARVERARGDELEARKTTEEELPLLREAVVSRADGSERSALDEPRPKSTPKVRPTRAKAATGLVNIDAQPYGQIWIDGRGYGVTPVVGARLSAGTHYLTAKSPSGKVRRVVLKVRAGKSQGVRLSW
jgi:hypothetical protein